MRDSGIIGGEGGYWATDNPLHASTFGKLTEFQHPGTKMADYGDVEKFMNDRGYDMIQDAEPQDWSDLQKHLRSQGYGGVDFGPMHRDDANDYWFLDNPAVSKNKVK